MKTLTTLLLTLLVLGGCTEEISHEKILERNGLHYKVNSETPFSGISIKEDRYSKYLHEYDEGKIVKKEQYDLNGQLRTRLNFKDKVEHGLQEHYFSNGQLSSRKTFNNGKENGIHIVFHFEGYLEQEIFFKEGKEQFFKSFRDDGTLKLSRERKGINYLLESSHDELGNVINSFCWSEEPLRPVDYSLCS